MAYQKITEGYVIQKYDDNGNPVFQEFIAGGDCDYENENGESVDVPNDEQYLPYDMVQPEKK